MGMRIALNGKSLFNWTGTSSEIDAIDEAVHKGLAATTDRSPEDVAKATVALLPQTGLATAGPGRQFQMMVIVWWILEQQSTHPDHPGEFRDHLPVWDFSIDLRIGQGSISVAVLASAPAIGTA